MAEGFLLVTAFVVSLVILPPACSGDDWVGNSSAPVEIILEQLWRPPLDSRAVLRTVSQAGFDVKSGAFPMTMRCLRARVIATFNRFGLSENPRRTVRDVDRIIMSRSAP